MNIGVDVRCLMDKNRTGVGEYAAGLLEATFKIDRENHFFLFYNSNKDISASLPKWDYENVHYVGTKYPNKLLNLLVWLKIIKIDKLLIKKYQSEIKKLRNKEISQFLNFSISQLDIWFSPNLNFTNLSKSIKHIQTIHDLSFEYFPEYFTWKRRLWHRCLNPRRQCQNADVIVTPSENTKRDVVDRYQIVDSRIQVLRPGISLINKYETDIKQILNKYYLTEKYILYLGTLEPRKNVETLIEAYKNLNSSPCRGGQGGVSLVLAGGSGWKNKKLMKLIQETPGVKYLGYVNEAEKSALFKNASLFVFPSLYEGFGLPVLEAMTCGVPVIASNRSSLPEVGQDAVYYVNPHNISELSEAMQSVLRNKELSNKMVGEGLEVSKKFSWQESAEKFLEILKNGFN